MRFDNDHQSIQCVVDQLVIEVHIMSDRSAIIHLLLYHASATSIQNLCTVSWEISTQIIVGSDWRVVGERISCNSLLFTQHQGHRSTIYSQEKSVLMSGKLLSISLHTLFVTFLKYKPCCERIVYSSDPDHWVDDHSYINHQSEFHSSSTFLIEAACSSLKE